jgi:hypothetical protein
MIGNHMGALPSLIERAAAAVARGQDLIRLGRAMCDRTSHLRAEARWLCAELALPRRVHPLRRQVRHEPDPEPLYVVVWVTSAGHVVRAPHGGLSRVSAAAAAHRFNEQRPGVAHWIEEWVAQRSGNGVLLN